MTPSFFLLSGLFRQAVNLCQAAPGDVKEGGPMHREKNYELARLQLRPNPKSGVPEIVLKTDRGDQARANLDIEILTKIREQTELQEDEISACIEAHGPNGDPQERLRLPQEILDQYHNLGQRLFKTLFVGEVGEIFESLWRDVVDRHPEDTSGLRIRIEIDPTHKSMLPLAGLPWELLQRSNPLTGDVLGKHRRAPLVRYIKSPGRGAPRQISAEGALRILVAVLEPDGREVKGEQDFIDTLQKLVKEHDGIARVSTLANPTLEEIRSALLKGQFHVLHVLGHGRFEDDAGIGALAIRRPDSPSRLTTALEFAEICKGLDHLALVVLCACEGAALAPSARNPFLSLAPALLDAPLPAVAAMQFTISHRAAIKLSQVFYDRLANFDAVDVALTEARLALSADDATSFEWPNAVLFSASRDCQIIAPVLSPESKSRERDSFDVGVLTFRDGWGQGIRNRSRDGFLDLSHYFLASEYRLLRPAEKTPDGLWPTTIIQEIREFTDRIDQSLPVICEFAAHNSLVFVTGRCLEDKSGLDIRIRQRGQGTQGDKSENNVLPPWTMDTGPIPNGDLWAFESTLPQPSKASDAKLYRDLVITVSVTHDIKVGVQTYLNRQDITPKRTLHATIHQGVGNSSIKSGAHAWKLADQLGARIREITMSETIHRVRLFAAAPNALMLYLGKGSRMFGAIQLYEHDFDAGRPDAYLPSLQIIPPRWNEYS